MSTESNNKIRNRKITRNMLKSQLKNNKIKVSWHSIYGHDVSNKHKQRCNKILKRIKRRHETKKLRRHEK